MGTWGLKNFENDGAADFTDDVLGNGKNLIKETILKVSEMNSDEYLEAPDCENALAAIEFIAAYKGNPSDDLPEDISLWIKENDLLNFKSSFFSKKVNIVDLSLKAIDRILLNSELKELWEESSEFEDWKKVVLDLKERISI